MNYLHDVNTSLIALPVSFSYMIYSLFSFLLRLVFSVNTLSPSSDNPQQFPLFFFFFSLDVRKIFLFTLFLRFFFFYSAQIYSEVSKRCSVGVVSKRGGGWWGGVHFIFHDFFSLNRSLENVCACQQRWGSWLFAAPLESQPNKDTEEKNTWRKKIQEKKMLREIKIQNR